ncbi:hypothetical protein Tco_0744293 [Tanacetum coccineum]
MGQSTQTMHMLTKPQVFYDESHKTTLGYQNPLYFTQAQRKVPALYCGRTIVKQHDALSVTDTEKTLELAEESRLKMHAKQNDPITKEKKVNIAPIDYATLNKLKYFEIEKKELIIENDRLLEHIIYQDVMSIVMHADVESKNVLPVNNHSLEYDNFEVKLLKKENDRLLELIISHDLVHTAVNSLDAIVDYQSMQKSYLNEYNECVELKVELPKKKEMVEKAVYNELSKRCVRMENRTGSDLTGSFSDTGFEIGNQNACSADNCYVVILLGSDDAIWSLSLQQKMINWRYYPSCAVHCLTLDDTTIYMLADRKYPLSKDACQVMLKMKLLDGTTDEVCYQLLKMIEKQARLI